MFSALIGAPAAPKGQCPGCPEAQAPCHIADSSLQAFFGEFPKVYFRRVPLVILGASASKPKGLQAMAGEPRGTKRALQADGVNYYVYKMRTADDLNKMENWCSAYKPRAAEFTYETVKDCVFIRTTVKNVRPRITALNIQVDGSTMSEDEWIRQKLELQGLKNYPT